MFRTLKYIPAWPKRPFKHLDEARQCVQVFITWYNTRHRHSGIHFVTPEQRQEGKDKVILAGRSSLYEAAKAKHPTRWRGRAVRNWIPVETV